MSRPVVLVTGATGKNGTQIVELLSEAGSVDVRAAVRDPKKADDLANLPNVTLVVLDGTNPEHLSKAFKGVNRVLILTPFVADPFPIGKAWIDAAKSAGADFILKFSAIGASPTNPTHVLADHYKQEEYVKASGLNYAIIRPSYFDENTLNNIGTIKSQNTWYGCCGEGKYAPIASSDISKSASMILLNPIPHKGKTYTLTGPQLLTETEVAEIFSKVLGRKITYTEVGKENLSKTLLSLHLPEFLAHDLVELNWMIATGGGAGLTDHVKQITGKDPITLEHWLIQNKSKFE